MNRFRPDNRSAGRRRRRFIIAAFVLAAMAMTGGGDVSAQGRAAAAARFEAAAALGLRIDSEILVLIVSESVLEVLNLVTIINSGSETSPEVPLALPMTAVGLSLHPGLPDQIERLPDALIDQSPLPAGEQRNYRLAYRVPLIELPATLARPRLLPVRSLTVMTEADVINIWNEELTDAGLEELDGRSMQVYSAVDLETVASSRLGLMPAALAEQHEGLPVIAYRHQPPGFFWAALAVLLSLGLFTAPRLFGGSRWQVKGIDRQSLYQERQHLIMELARIEEAGGGSGKAVTAVNAGASGQERRQAVMAELMAITRVLEEGDG